MVLNIKKNSQSSAKRHTPMLRETQVNVGVKGQLCFSKTECEVLPDMLRLAFDECFVARRQSQTPF